MISKTKIIFFILCSIIISCNAQHSVESNEIFTSPENKIGVKSSNGEVLIQPIFLQIVPVGKSSRKRLPPLSPQEKIQKGYHEYYKVVNENRELALFDATGKVIIDFCPCQAFQIDLHTKTIVSELQKGKYKSILYSFDGEKILQDSFQNIGYINDSDLIALIKNDGSIDEFYLFNPFSKDTLGPYDHFNIYNRDFDPTMGIKSIEFKKLIDPIGISVRNEKKWGFVSMQGKEILPMKFSSFRYIDASVQNTYIKLSKKPKNVEFMFYARLKEDRSKLIFIDNKLNEYSFTRDESGSGTITLME